MRNDDINMRKTDLATEVFSLIEARFNSRPSAIEFEMAYQIRVAIDCIRLVIKATDVYDDEPQLVYEAGQQLLEALERLVRAERHFQRWSRQGSSSDASKAARNNVNGKIGNFENGDS